MYKDIKRKELQKNIAFEKNCVNYSKSLNFKDNRGHNMWQKFKIDLKCPPPPFISVVKIKQYDCKHLRTIILHINIDKGGRGAFFCVFDFLPHYYVHDCLNF